MKTLKKIADLSDTDIKGIVSIFRDKKQFKIVTTRSDSYILVEYHRVIPTKVESYEYIKYYIAIMPDFSIKHLWGYCNDTKKTLRNKQICYLPNTQFIYKFLIEKGYDVYNENSK